MTRTFNLLVLGLLITICFLGTFYGPISFGLGLGDIVGYGILYVGAITHLILTIKLRTKRLSQLFLAFSFLTFTILIFLKATIWRESQYPWNGHIFYLACPTNIKVENQEIKTELLIQMCSMEYDSKFNGIWNGQKVTIKEGDIQIPSNLERYIKRPISATFIEPDVWERFENDSLFKDSQFNKDTLET
jgi:hypothetical protein